METKTHWKQFVNLDYIGAYSLNGKDLTVKISSVAQEMVTGDKGKKEMCIVAKLEGQKPFIINRTNAKQITKLYGSPFIEDWKGKLITLFPTTTSVGGETVECLRIRPTAPKEIKPDYSAQEKALNDCNTLEELQRVFLGMTADQKSALVDVKDLCKDKLRGTKE